MGVVWEKLPVVATIEAALAPDAPELFAEAPLGFVPSYGAGAWRAADLSSAERSTALATGAGQ